MDELFNSVFQYILLSFYGISTLTAVLFYGKYKHTVLKYFVWILLYNLINEISAKYVYYWLDRNVVMYNVYNTIFFLYFLYVFRSFVQSKTYKKWIFYSTVLFSVVTVVNAIVVNAYFDNLMTSYITGACLLIFCIILYLSLIHI